MTRSKCKVGGVLLSLTGLLGACGAGTACGDLPQSPALKSGTYETLPGAKLSFPFEGIQKKTMAYDKSSGKLTITYTHENRLYIETWIDVLAPR